MSDVLDLDALRHLRTVIGGDTDDLMELVEDFVATLPSQIKDMRTLVASSDFLALRIAAHSCKSNARDLGAPALSLLCAELEKACAEGQATQVAPLVDQIEMAAPALLDGYARLEPTDV